VSAGSPGFGQWRDAVLGVRFFGPRGRGPSVVRGGLPLGHRQLGGEGADHAGVGLIDFVGLEGALG